MTLSDLIAKAVEQMQLAESLVETNRLFSDAVKREDYLGKTGAAVSALETALKEAPGSICLNLTLAGVYLKKAEVRFYENDYNGAISDFEAARDAAKNAGVPTQQRLAAEFSNPALSVFTGFRNLDNVAATLLLTLGQAYDFLSAIQIKKGMPLAAESSIDMAKTAYSALMKNYPNFLFSGVAAYKLGDLLFRQGSFREAFSSYQKSLLPLAGTPFEERAHSQFGIAAMLLPESPAGPDSLSFQKA